MKLVFPGKFSGLVGDLPEDLPRPSGVETLADLIAWVAAQRPQLGEAMKLSRAKAIVNFTVVHDLLHVLADDDEIAFLPPMSGG
jgi:molybdopterin converting factor small subunit